MISNESRMKVDSFEINVSIKTLVYVYVYVYVYMQDETEAVSPTTPARCTNAKNMPVYPNQRESQRHEE
jgi:hypothetical protein